MKNAQELKVNNRLLNRKNELVDFQELDKLKNYDLYLSRFFLISIFLLTMVFPWLFVYYQIPLFLKDFELLKIIDYKEF